MKRSEIAKCEQDNEKILERMRDELNETSSYKRDLENDLEEVKRELEKIETEYPLEIRKREIAIEEIKS